MIKKLTNPLLSMMAWGYIICSLPLMVLFIKSEHVRFMAVQEVTRWKGKTIGLTDAYLGDSITAGGRNWGRPFDAINLAGEGYTTWQIEVQLVKAMQHNPKHILILAGSNDILGRRTFNIEQFEQDYTSLLDKAIETQKNVIITMIPYTARERHIQPITEANMIIQRLAHERKVPIIDLNSVMAPQKLLLPKFTTDGAHLSPEAYRIWREKIQEVKQRMQEQA